MRITEAMVRRFCEANARAIHGNGCDCDGEYHDGIRGDQCAPCFCECENPVPDPTYYNRCMATVDDPANYNRCYGFIPGVTKRRDGRPSDKRPKT